jgi:predicted Zn-dependent peptidase
VVGPGVPFRFPAVHRHVLDNGIEVRAIEHDGVPLVSALLLVPSGAAADPADRHGLVAFTADLLDEGSGGRSAIEVSERLAGYGADHDIEVGSDAAALSITTLSRCLPDSLALLAEMVSRPNLFDADIERVRKLRVDRLRQLKDHAAAVAQRALAHALYGDHPYGHLGLGTDAALHAITTADIRAFHRDVFVPAESTIVIAGDQSVDHLVAAVSGAFGDWVPLPDRRPLNRLAGLATPPHTPASRFVVVPRAGSAQSEIRIGHVCASRATPDYHALVLLNTILGGDFVSRLNMNLRQDKGYTYGVRTGFDLRKGLGPFVVQTSVQTEVTLAAIREVLTELEAIRGDRPVTSDELTLAKATVTRGYARGFETAPQIVRGVAQLALHGLPDTCFEEFTPRVEAITLDEIHRVARTYLDTSRMLTLVVGDPDRLGQASAAGIGEPHFVEA